MQNPTYQSDRNRKPVPYYRYRLLHANQRFPRQRVQTSNREDRMWWTHVWSGLVRDPTGKNFKKLKGSVWLYLYLLLGANWRTGKLFRRVATIAKDMSIPDRTITRWLKILREGG